MTARFTSFGDIQGWPAATAQRQTWAENFFTTTARPSFTAGWASTIFHRPTTIAGRPATILRRAAIIVGWRVIVEARPATNARRPAAVVARAATIFGQPAVVHGQPIIVAGRKLALISQFFAKILHFRAFPNPWGETPSSRECAFLGALGGLAADHNLQFTARRSLAPPAPTAPPLVARTGRVCVPVLNLLSEKNITNP
jgi:hypothetical protein